MLIKTFVPNIIRDTNSMALHNIDPKERAEYYAKTKQITDQKKEINRLDSKIMDINNELKEIKDLLNKLVQIK